MAVPSGVQKMSSANRSACPSTIRRLLMRSANSSPRPAMNCADNRSDLVERLARESRCPHTVAVRPDSAAIALRLRRLFRELSIAALLSVSAWKRANFSAMSSR